MNKVYRFVRGVVQETLHKNTTDSMSARLKASDAASINDGLEELVGRIGKLKAAVTDGQAVVADEAKHTEQTIESLRANIAVLEANLTETEDTVRRKDVESQRVQESLNTKIGDLQTAVNKKEEALERGFAEVNDLTSKIDVLEKQVIELELAIQQAKDQAASEAQRVENITESSKAKIATIEAQFRGTEQSLNRTIGDLQSAVNKKEEALERRCSEVNDLTSKVDVLEKQVIELELAIQQAKDQAASEAQRVENITESSKAKIATIEVHFREIEQIVRGKDATIKALDESLTAKIHDLESQLRNKETLLAEQIGQVTDLKFELQCLTNAMKEMSSLSGEAGALGDTVTGRAVVNEQLKTGEEKSATSHFGNGGVTSKVRDADRQTVSVEVFDHMIDALFEFTDVERPIASLIVLHHVECLGESMEAFPQTRLTELLEAVSGEISDDKLRTAFCQRLGKR
jgi:DNA repair exonuclease SbcCD ATPase subunit